MNPAQLTHTARIGHKASMRADARRGKAATVFAAVMLGASLVSGCITVNAPEDAIVIELNINITQEVIYRLASDVRENIDENPEIF